MTDPEYSRVRSGIAGHIVAFCRSRVGATFHAEDLRRYVAQRTDRAPSSADRILRGLRDEGVIGYTVEDRASSLYSVQAVNEDATPEQRKARALNASAARDCLRLAGKLRALGMEGEARKAEEWAKYLEPPPVVVEDCGQVGMFA